MSEERESRPFIYLPLLLPPPALLPAPLDSMLLPMPCPPLLVPAPLLPLAPAVNADLIDELAKELLPEAPEEEAPMPSGDGRDERGEA